MSRKTIYASYDTSFKIAAVLLAQLPDVLTKDVAEALDIHPFMLSRWKKEYREGLIVGDPKIPIPEKKTQASELKRLRQVEKQYRQLQAEHDLLKKAIRFTSERKKKSSNSSK